MESINAAQRPGIFRRRVTAVTAATVFGLTGVIGGGLMSAAHADDPTTVSAIVLGVGSAENQRVVSWYTSANVDQAIQVVPTSQLVAGAFPADATAFPATVAANVVNGGFNAHATITGLAENTAYSYRVGNAAGWSATYAFKTQSFEGDFDFLFFGDPQIGASGNIPNDGAGWADTLSVATAANPDAELLVSGGDQVETANTETQWNAFLGSDVLRQYPWAATIGNHDVGGKAYEQHFWTPNTDRSAALYAGSTATQSGGDYWYVYKDVLFIDLNSNAYAGGSDAAHISYVTDVINAHGSEAKYTVLAYHHSIYSPAAHANDGDAKVRRQDFPTAFSNLGVDLVLQGHDHSYSRSYVIKNGTKANPAEQPGAANVEAGPGGVIYVTGNSASGSKYYDLSTPSTTDPGYGADPLFPAHHAQNSVENQEYARTYVKVQVRHDKLVVENIRSQAHAGDAVGSTVDKVVIAPYHGDGQDIQVDVPDAPVGEFGWTIDGTNGLVDLGTATHSGDFFEATGEINPISVLDSRRTKAPWSISSSVGDFTDGSKTFPGSFLGWTPKIVQPGAGAVAGSSVVSGYGGGGAGLSISRGLGFANQGHDKGDAKLGADLDLKLPDDIAKGSYRATLTITALSS